MKSIIFIVSILFVDSNVALSCCAEAEYRLLPIGELNEKLIFIEFDFHRNCRMRNEDKGAFNFYVRGTVNLVTYEHDSLVFLENIDTLYISECTCSYDNYLSKTSYEKHFEIAYLKGLNSAKKNDISFLQKQVEYHLMIPLILKLRKRILTVHFLILFLIKMNFKLI